MGLDMYMYRTSKENICPDLQEEEGYREKAQLFARELENVAYWRKFNALHGWLVDNAQDGVDECQYSVVSEELLDDLATLISKSLHAKSALLEPVDGFFFGGTEIDEYYWEDMKETFDVICKILADTNFEKDQIIYCSSW